MKKEIVLIFPHQLFEKHPALNKERPIYLIEHPRFFSLLKFHKQKLILHRASMKAFAALLKKRGYIVHYIEHRNAQLKKFFSAHPKTYIHCAEVVDYHLEQELKKLGKDWLVIHQTPAFLTSPADIRELLGKKNHYFMNSFYIAQRKRLGILVKNGKPLGGYWSFDKENRHKIPAGIAIPRIRHPKKTPCVADATHYVETHFSDHRGDVWPFIWPTTHTEAKKWYTNFLIHRFSHFGPYQDAIDSSHTFLFHSLLSPLLNCGLLTPDYVVRRALSYARQKNVPLQSLEGFIRQVIGWREFVRAVYYLKGEIQRKSNFFKHSKKLVASFWHGTTGIPPIDDTIKKIVKTGYAHHIERLMVLGNFMLLTEVDPDEVYTWFMEHFIDAYDWVMVPNVYGMSQYADGGLMTSKPYFSSSHYILSMSRYKKGDWSVLWDALYWNFIQKNKVALSQNARLSFIKLSLKRMHTDTLKKYREIAKSYL